MRRKEAMLKLKIKQEGKLEKNFAKWFRKGIKKVAVQIRKTGSNGITIPTAMKGELEKILLTHWKDTFFESLPEGMMKASKSISRSEMSRMIRKIVQDTENEIDEYSSGKITEAVDKTFEGAESRLEEIAVLALLALQKQNNADGTDVVNNTALSRMFTNLANDRVKGHSQTVANVQTNGIMEETRRKTVKNVSNEMVLLGSAYIEQNASKRKDTAEKIRELTKYAERESADDYLPKLQKYADNDNNLLAEAVVGVFALIKKKWQTMGDSKVRPTHKRAEQTGAIPVDEYFIVGAYEMLFPLDTSRGAGLEEIVNCRCWLLYV